MCLFAEIRGSAAPPETAPTLQASQLLRQGAKLWLGGGQRSVTHSRICYSDVVKVVFIFYALEKYVVPVGIMGRLGGNYNHS